MNAKMKLLLNISLVYLFLSCIPTNGDNSKSKGENYNQNSKLSQKDAKKTKSSHRIIESENFIIALMDISLNISNVRGEYELIEKQEVKNKHNISQIDTLLAYGNKMDSIFYYSTEYKSLILEAKIKSNRIVMEDSLSIGTNWVKFQNRFELQEKFDTLRVENQEGLIFVNLIFVSDTLNKLHYKSNYQS